MGRAKRNEGTGQTGMERTRSCQREDNSQTGANRRMSFIGHYSTLRQIDTTGNDVYGCLPGAMTTKAIRHVPLWCRLRR